MKTALKSIVNYAYTRIVMLSAKEKPRLMESKCLAQGHNIDYYECLTSLALQVNQLLQCDFAAASIFCCCYYPVVFVVLICLFFESLILDWARICFLPLVVKSEHLLRAVLVTSVLVSC